MVNQASQGETVRSYLIQRYQVHPTTTTGRGHEAALNGAGDKDAVGDSMEPIEPQAIQVELVAALPLGCGARCLHPTAESA